MLIVSDAEAKELAAAKGVWVSAQQAYSNQQRANRT